MRRGAFSPRFAFLSTQASLRTSARMPTSARHLNNSELFRSVLCATVVVVTTTWQLSSHERTSGLIAPVGGKIK
eukprot:12704326-Alexandrium_andersonii.AAC.1